MSDKLPQEPQSEEVDLGQLFNAIGKLFEKLFNFISKVLKGLFSALIFALKPFVNNFKWVAIVLMLAALLGYISEKLSKPVYTSDMLVRPYYDSKYQLANNIDYFNALIASENHQELAEIFNIDSDSSASQMLGFEIEIGPETPNDLLQQYDAYIKSIDSTLAVDLTYEDFIENRDVLAGNVFSIKAKATRNDIFPSLENGFIKTFENEYSRKVKRRMDSTRLVKKDNYLAELKRVESLQEIYIDIKKNESEKGEASIGVGGLIPITIEKTTTKEYELFQEELKIRKALRAIEEEEIEQGDFFDILSGFEEVGSKETDLFNKHSLLFPAISLLIMILAYALFKVFKFIKEYE
ncbi:DUF1097 domain-containing protein [uncultured Winogradskyella sp.]|uniref:DUF1097 domain-containing protein n=1 Tax=uncultured Winogradskyella sp. TaxID=395353 RepID=UPI00262B6922|nr:DUF1097 domain-containing protein [uncultured Winogradskyella sp.]